MAAAVYVPSTPVLRAQTRSAYIPSPPAKAAYVPSPPRWQPFASQAASTPVRANVHVPSPPLRRNSAPILTCPPRSVPKPLVFVDGHDDSQAVCMTSPRPMRAPYVPSPPPSTNSVIHSSTPERCQYLFVTGGFLYTVSAPGYLPELNVWYNAVFLPFHNASGQTWPDLLQIMKPELTLSPALRKRIAARLPKSYATPPNDRVVLLDRCSLIQSIPYGAPTTSPNELDLKRAYNDGAQASLQAAHEIQQSLAISNLALAGGNDASVRADISIYNQSLKNVEPDKRPPRVQRKHVFSVRSQLYESTSLLTTKPTQTIQTSEGRSMLVGNVKVGAVVAACVLTPLDVVCNCSFPGEASASTSFFRNSTCGFLSGGCFSC